MTLLLAPLLLVRAAVAVPLLLERFDGSALPEGWKASAAGAGPKPKATVAAGVLTLETAPGEKRVVTVGRKVEVRNIAWLKLSAKQTAEGGGALCGLYYRFEDQPLRAAVDCAAGTKEVVRYLAVPERGWMVEVGAGLDGPGKLSLDDVALEAAAPEWKGVQRGRFSYHSLGGTAFSEDQLAANDAALERVDAFFGASSGAVDWWWYPTLDSIEQFTGTRAEAVVDGGTVHSIWRGRTLELVQHAMAAWGAAPTALAAGVAVHLDGEFDGRDLRLGARGLAGRGELPTVATILDPAAWAALDPATAALGAGAFVRWVVEVKGLATLRAVASGGAAGLGMSPSEADAALRAWL